MMKWTAKKLDTFKTNAEEMLNLGKEWQRSRIIFIIKPLRDAAEQLDKSTKTFHREQAVTTGIGATTSAIVLLGILGPVAVGVCAGALVIGTISGVVSTAFSVQNIRREKAAIEVMEQLRAQDADLLRDFVSTLRAMGLPLQELCGQDLSDFQTPSLLAFASKCGFYSFAVLTETAFEGLKLTATAMDRVFFAAFGVSMVFDAYACWKSASRLAGTNSEQAEQLQRLADTLSQNTTDILEELERTLMEEFMETFPQNILYPSTA